MRVWTACLLPPRIRKVKCDETKPFCLRCTKTGRKCDGYLGPALTKKRQLKNNTPRDHIPDPLYELCAPEEKRAFHFFQHVTAPCISGGFNAVFWRSIVLQICQTEPAVRHAVLAVSSLHEGIGAGSALQPADRRLAQSAQSFALQQYNKAIARLLNQMSTPLARPLATLLTCVLFVCIEYMQGKDKESLIHLEQGRQLLARLDQRSSDPEMECIVRHIVPLYTRLSLTSFLFGGSPVPIPDAFRPHKDVPDTFDSIDSLRHCMHEFMEQSFRFIRRARPAKNNVESVSKEAMRLLKAEQGCLLTRHEKLNVAFSLFRASMATPAQAHVSVLLVLQMYLYAQRIWISTALSHSELIYDEFISSFAAIVPLAAAYLEQERSSLHPQRGPPFPGHSRYISGSQQLSVAFTSNFSFETHIIPPLYYVATKCRHPLIRRSALELLTSNPSRRENLWRASVMGALAAHIVSLEEGWTHGHAFPVTVGSMSNTTSVSSGASDHGAAPGDIQQRQPGNRTDYLDAHAGHGNLYSMGTNAETRLVPVAQSVEQPMDPSLLMDEKMPALLEDGYPPGSTAESQTSFVGTPSQQSDSWVWQQHRHRLSDSSDLAFTSSAPHESIPSQDYRHAGLFMDYHEQTALPMPEYSLHYSSSDMSSDEAEDQLQYQVPLARGQATPDPQQQQQQQYHDLQMRQANSNLAQTQSRYQQHHHTDAATPGEPSSRSLSTEAPFGLPEELRVHEAAIMGPEMEEGSWVVIFRKLHGADADWDIRQDWVAAM